MIRKTLRRLDQTRKPTKYYKYGYVQEPRKQLPYEQLSADDFLPTVIRPPMASLVPDVDTFLEKIDIHEKCPTGDFKGSFHSWNEFMTATLEDMMKMGMSRPTARWILKSRDFYNSGMPPIHYDRKEERKYWRQFDTKDNSHRKIPELPEKYRPHQLGEDQRPVPDYEAINAMPEWAQKEEIRLNEGRREA